MDSLEFIGFCGVDCSACPDLRDQKCPGCRQTVWPDDDPCPPVACCAEKSISCCGLCPEFPCQMMQEFYEESEGHKKARRLMCELREKAN